MKCVQTYLLKKKKWFVPAKMVLVHMHHNSHSNHHPVIYNSFTPTYIPIISLSHSLLNQAICLAASLCFPITITFPPSSPLYYNFLFLLLVSQTVFRSAFNNQSSPSNVSSCLCIKVATSMSHIKTVPERRPLENIYSNELHDIFCV